VASEQRGEGGLIAAQGETLQQLVVWQFFILADRG
jgi:hypothetical protein